jgi:hypothetical protein
LAYYFALWDFIEANYVIVGCVLGELIRQFVTTISCMGFNPCKHSFPFFSFEGGGLLPDFFY